MAKQILEIYKNLVWPEIKKYLVDPEYPASFKIPSSYKSDLKYYWKIVKEYPERQGKYLRPSLLILTSEAMGSKNKLAIKSAAAMQFSEDWLLVHDDIQDHSEARRGKPALHRIYGSELAINAGDTLHIIMWKLLMDNINVLDVKKTFLIANEFYKVLKRTADGQAVEIMWSKNKTINLSEKDWFFIADGKTAYYTIAAPMRIGGIIAGANEVQLNHLTEFGLYLGRCFQIIDDILDLTVEYKGAGQKVGSDIYESKKTLILSHLIKTANPTDRNRINKILAKASEEKTSQEVKWVIQKIYEYGSIEYAKSIAQKMKKKALVIFETKLQFLSGKTARDRIRQIVNFIVERDH